MSQHDCGNTRAILTGLGHREMIGGQEDMIADAVLEMAKWATKKSSQHVAG
jgi:hypothetical protein